MIAAITPETDITATLAAAGGAFVAVFWAGWKIANAIRDLVEEIKGLRKDVRAAWTREEHERWSFRLERENAGLPLVVPPIPSRADAD